MTIIAQDVQNLINGWLEQESNGVQFWDARELMDALGYPYWQKAKSVIERAKLSCVESGQRVEDHFLSCLDQEVGRPKEGYKLSRYAFYLASMSGSPSKAGVASVRSYFSKKLMFADYAAWLLTGAIPNPFCGFNGTEYAQDLSGFIYLVEATGTQRQKIGYSKSVYRRLSQMQTSCPFDLIVLERVFSLDCQKLESLLHKYFDAYRVRGEWFELPAEEIANFAATANRLDTEVEQMANVDRNLWLGE